MVWIPIAQTATFLGALLLTLIFVYLYSKENEQYLKVWALGWGIYCLGYILSGIGFIISSNHLILSVSIISVHLAFLLNALSLLYGSVLLAERPWKPIWGYLYIVPAVWDIIFVSLDAHFLVYSAPIYLTIFVSYFLTGITILKIKDTSQLVKRIAGGGFILWAAHQLNYLLIKDIEWLLPWGYMLSALLQYIVALAMVLIFFERNLATLSRREQELSMLNIQLETKVADRTAQLQDAVQEMESFSYSVSHDLRAPVRAVIGFSGILEEEYAAEMPDDAKIYLDHIAKNGLRMEELIQDLLKLSRIGRQELDNQIVNLSEIAQNAFDDLLQSFDAPDKVHFVARPTEDVLVDQNMMRLLFDNLISNALKFSQHNDRIEIEFGEKESAQGCEYYVKDNGVGFSMEYSDKLFTVFQRLHSSEDFEGTGVGLATVKRIITRHNGKIWAESQPGKGTVFYFQLNSQN